MILHLDHVTVVVRDVAEAKTFFHARTLVFLSGPEGITVELAEWHV